MSTRFESREARGGLRWYFIIVQSIAGGRGGLPGEDLIRFLQKEMLDSLTKLQENKTSLASLKMDRMLMNPILLVDAVGGVVGGEGGWIGESPCVLTVWAWYMLFVSRTRVGIVSRTRIDIFLLRGAPLCTNGSSARRSAGPPETHC
jgi:hypothetical protein